MSDKDNTVDARLRALEAAQWNEQDVAALQLPRLRKPKEVVGERLRFRDATEADAEFILSLRLDTAKNQYLSATSPDLDAQIRWLRNYASDDQQVYFIIEAGGRRVGTVRLYDVRGNLFSWGSWILSAEAPKSSAVESTLMVYEFGFECYFHGAHFEVRKENVKVVDYHERFGAVRVAEDNDNYYYEIHEQKILEAMERYASRIPSGIKVNF